MRKCPYASRVGDVECVNPHLNCGQDCPVFKQFKDGVYELVKTGLVRTPRIPKFSDPRPYVKIGNPSGKPGIGVEVGIRGTF